MNISARLKGKVAVITGASRGIGAACAKAFAQEGALVALFDLESERDEGVALARNIGSSAAFFSCDVTDEAECKVAVNSAADHFGPITVLVNNAGVAIPGGLEEMSTDDWNKTFAINVNAIHLLGRYVLPIMRDAGIGSIINVASESAFIGFPMHPAYCASKAAAVHLSRSMAVRYASDNIRVNSLCPGTVDTALYRKFLKSLPNPEEAHQQVLDMHPLGIGEPEDVAMAAVFLASDESKYITGSPLLVDGGSTSQ